MKVSVDKHSSCMATIAVEVPAPDVDKAWQHALRTVGKKAQLPGFRPGHVPSTLIERQFRMQVVQACVEHLVGETLWPALAEAKLEPVAQPSLKSAGAVARGTPFHYQADVEFQPDIKVSQLDGLKVAAPAPAAEENTVETALERLREERAETVPVEGRSTVQSGDFVLLDFKGTFKGEPLPGGQGENTLVEVGGKDYIPGFAEGLIGAQVPGQTRVEVVFPPNYEAQELQNQPASFEMTLKELKVRQLPALDDAFAKDLGDEDLSQTRKRLEDELAAQAKAEAERQRRRAALEALVAANAIEVPPSRVDEQLEFMIDGFEQQLQRYAGPQFKLGPERRADLRSERREEADFLVKAGLLMHAAAESLHIVIDDSAIDAEIERIALAEGPERAPMVRQALASAETRQKVGFRLTEDRVVEHILGKAQAA